jgi:hypothetical protein
MTSGDAVPCVASGCGHARSGVPRVAWARFGPYSAGSLVARGVHWHICGSEGKL